MKPTEKCVNAWLIFRRYIFWGLVLFGLLSTGCVSPPGKYISIESTPTAEIYVDGVLVGVTPERRVKVEAGTHVELKAKGYHTSSIRISGVAPNSLSINRAITQKRITITGDGIKVILKER